MKTTHYVARQPDEAGFIHYSDTEHQVWNTLITRQLELLDGRACQAYFDGLEQLDLPTRGFPSSARSTACSAPPPAGASPRCRR